MQTDSNTVLKPGDLCYFSGNVGVPCVYLGIATVPLFLGMDHTFLDEHGHVCYTVYGNLKPWKDDEAQC